MKALAPLLAGIFYFSSIQAYELESHKPLEHHYGIPSKDTDQQSTLSRYVRNPYVNQTLWDELKPYFLPENHPAKKPLDAIFSKKRILSSRKAMKHAGFDVFKHPQRDIVIARHPEIRGYIIKAYLDNKQIDEWAWWKKRIDGVRQVQECIDRNHFGNMMKTPKKWIYPLPSEPSPPGSLSSRRKNFILIAEDMFILPKKENLRAYKEFMTPLLLNAIFIVLTENLLVDSIFIPNIPFSYDGKIAVLDTEHFNNVNRPMKLWKMLRYLSPEMRAYWRELVPLFTPSEGAAAPETEVPSN